LNKEIGRFWEKMIYDRGTVQPGAAMTVKEMGAGEQCILAGPFFCV
jgi:hypothetical protein